VAVDFSVAGGVAANARACALEGVPILVGTTGLDSAARSLLERTAKDVPVLIAQYQCRGERRGQKLVFTAASALWGPPMMWKSSRRHHRMKLDAPVGYRTGSG